MGILNSGFEKYASQANHLPVILKSRKPFKIYIIFDHHLLLTEQFTESQAAS
jgi:hypothetical protein